LVDGRVLAAMVEEDDASKGARAERVRAGESRADVFLKEEREDGEFNQYWYTRHTIAVLADEAEQAGGRCAFLATPSVYFSLGSERALAGGAVFDLDPRFGPPTMKKGGTYVQYDFKEPAAFPPELKGAFDMVVIDPPFIVEEVWVKFAETARMLLKEGGKVLCTTVPENAPFMETLLGVKPQPFWPAMRTIAGGLPYQYVVYANYASPALQERNPDIPSFAYDD